MTLIDPFDLQHNLERLEDIEKTTLRLVVQAIYDYRKEATAIFQAEKDQVADIGEDITREALDRLGVPRVHQRLFGKMDYKRACYLFHPQFAVKQALLVDSKAEHISGEATATLQTAQTSLIIRHIRAGELVSVQGKLPQVLTLNGEQFITTTIFVKYSYSDSHEVHVLERITVAALPNGMLQERYNPNEQDTIWRAGRNAPSRGEEFRVRLNFSLLKQKSCWRVQHIPVDPLPFVWEA